MSEPQQVVSTEAEIRLVRHEAPDSRGSKVVAPTYEVEPSGWPDVAGNVA